MPRWSGLLTVVVMAGLVAFLAYSLFVSGESDDPNEPQGSRDRSRDTSRNVRHHGQPNIVVVMTDDQTAESVRVMPQLQELVGDEGITFKNAFVSNPVCCPSRTTFLTGQYAHNTGVLRNTLPDGGYAAFEDDETLPVWLRRAGYYTGHIGKYLNGYGDEDPTTIPPGWNEWYGSPDLATYRMYGYRLNENGVLRTYGDYEHPDPNVYQTDVYAQRAVDFIRRRVDKDAPFYLSVAPVAPHSEDFRPADGISDPPDPALPNPRPAPRHEERFGGEVLPEGPSFNETDVSDKPEGIRNLRSLGQSILEVNRKRYRARLASLLAVDDMMGRLGRALRNTEALEDTVIVFLSDNGFLLGEHRIKGGKEYPYEESIGVPLQIRGPGIPAGQVRDGVVANVDLAPTLLDLASARAGGPIDGVSLLPMIRNEQPYSGRGIVIENWCQVNDRKCYDPASPETPRYRGVRTDRYVYMRYPNDEEEMYDLERDPAQLESLHADPDYDAELQALSRLLDRLQLCRATGCMTSPRIDLDLAYTPKTLSDGERCAASAVDVTLGGRDAVEIVSTSFFVPDTGRIDDAGGRTRLRIDASELDTGQVAQLVANVSVLDGRIESLTAELPVAC